MFVQCHWRSTSSCIYGKFKEEGKESDNVDSSLNAVSSICSRKQLRNPENQRVSVHNFDFMLIIISSTTTDRDHSQLHEHSLCAFSDNSSRNCVIMMVLLKVFVISSFAFLLLSGFAPQRYFSIFPCVLGCENFFLRTSKF
jgi:hypothetical protein